MPRLNRFDVTFTACGKNWLARFSHQHTPSKRRQSCIDDNHGSGCAELACFDMSGVPYRSPHGRHTLVQHITTCRLSYADDLTKAVKGISPCSLKDHYDWRRGIKRSFQKALENGRYCVFEKGAGLAGRHKSTCSYQNWELNDKAILCPNCGVTADFAKEVVVPIKEDYGPMMAAFHRELSNRPAPTGVTLADIQNWYQKLGAVNRAYLVAAGFPLVLAPSTDIIEATVVEENQTPPENKAGLAYAGMD